MIADCQRFMQTLSNVENIYKSTAFKDVIFGCGSQMAKPLSHPVAQAPGLTTVRFRIMYASIPYVWACRMGTAALPAPHCLVTQRHNCLRGSALGPLHDTPFLRAGTIAWCLARGYT